MGRRERLLQAKLKGEFFTLEAKQKKAKAQLAKLRSSLSTLEDGVREELVQLAEARTLGDIPLMGRKESTIESYRTQAAQKRTRVDAKQEELDNINAQLESVSEGLEKLKGLGF